jgi:predicted CDP-diglyceride synthetase/phosphatidate cytidylyltransferase
LFGGILAGGLTAILTDILLLSAPWPKPGVGPVLGPLGKLGETYLIITQRTAGLKDSGRILMGHGGIWIALGSVVNLRWLFIRLAQRMIICCGN